MKFSWEGHIILHKKTTNAAMIYNIYRNGKIKSWRQSKIQKIIMNDHAKGIHSGA